MKSQLNVIESTELATLWLRRRLGDAMDVIHVPMEASLEAQEAWAVWRMIDGDQLTAFDAALDDIWALRRRCPRSLIVAQVAVADVDYFWALNRAGASIVVHRAVHAEAAADQIRNFYRKIPGPCLSLEERIWKNLPWGQ